ncbi:ureidoglycolate lyase [Pseudomonas sp. RC10]|uniref:ureidoglycolate lyase n=1 Tax=Pseudomonas bambusae TaxID=3139142 RepID=UPI003139DF71
MSDTELLHVEPLSAGAFEPYGWMLGEPYDPKGTIPGFSNAATDFWQTHVFDPGMGGRTEVLWVNYRSHEDVAVLEVHRLTQQAIVPLTGPVIHIVATSLADGEPDLNSLKAFRIEPGQGICMRPGCWHASRVEDAEVTCLMLTRSSTTLELIDHMTDGTPAEESALRPITPKRRVAAGTQQ